MSRNLLTLFIILISFQGCSRGQHGNKITLKEINWTITLPSDFTILNSTASNEVINNQATNFKKLTRDDLQEMPEQKILLMANNVKTKSTFACTISKCDSSVLDWHGFLEFQDSLTYKAYQELKYTKNSDAQIDTIHNEMIIDQVKFDEFTLSVSSDKKILFQALNLRSIYNGYYVLIVLENYDTAIYSKITSMLANSKFEKQ